MNNNNYYVICGWMINELGLKGIKRDVYAIIYGFTQNYDTKFNGSLTYLQEFTGASRQSIVAALKELTEEELIEKEVVKNGCRYWSKNLTSLQEKWSKNLTETSQKILQPINQDNNNKLYINKKINNNKSTILTDSELRDLIEKEFNNVAVTHKFLEYVEMRKGQGKNKAVRTQATLTSCINKLRRYARTSNEAVEILTNSIENCWTGLFPLKKIDKDEIPYG